MSKKLYREWGRRYRQEHKEAINAYQRRYYQENLDQREKNKARSSKHYYEHREECLAHSKIYGAQWRLSLKLVVLTHYGNGECRCVKCGESRMACLSIDHIGGNGNAHRRIVGSGDKFYAWLRRGDYPEGYQTLCMNCQFVKRIEDKVQIF